MVDGERVDTLGTKVFPDQRIDIDPAAEAFQSSQVTVIVHKPVGLVSGQAEDGYQPAITLVTPENRWEGDHSGIRFSASHLRQLAPAGRLDIDSTGLLVLTQDGRIAKQLIGGHSDVDKEYLVRVAYGDHTVDVESHFPAEKIALLRHGLSLDDVALKPAQVSWQNGEQLRFVLREGKKRQIRRMQLLPQTRQAAQLVFVEPRLDLAFGLHVFLQLPERGEARVELMDLRAFGLHALLRGAAFTVEPRQCFLRVGEAALRVVKDFLVLGELHAILDKHGLEYELQWTVSGLPFLTPRGKLSSALAQAIKDETGVDTELSTTGGTSDGRFIARICEQVIEFGPLNASIHKIDEHIEVAHIEPLKNVYRRVLEQLIA